MKLIKLVALTAFITIGTLSAILYTSCTKDACKGVTCLNKGTCNGGSCVCPGGLKGGIGGLNCETVYRKLYAGVYVGNPTGNVGHTDSNNTLIFTPTADTANFNTMQLIWQDTGTTVVILPITLANNSASGSTFTVDAPTTGANGKTYTGGGTISQTTASLTLTERKDTTVVQLNFNNFRRQ